MTITRERQASWAMETGSGWNIGYSADFVDGSDILIDPIPGASHALNVHGRGPFYWNTVPSRQKVYALHYLLAGLTTIADWITFQTALGAAEIFKVRMGNSGCTLVVGGVERATTPTTPPTLTWSFWAVDAKIDPAAGWVKVYLNGANILSFTGNTGNTDIGRIAQAFPLYDDSCTCNRIDDTTGEAMTAVSPPDRRFYYKAVTSDGEALDGVPTPDSPTTHYDKVDEHPASGGTDYVTLDAVNEDELYHVGDYVPPAGFTVVAVIIGANALKTDGAVGTQIGGLIKLTGSATKLSSAAQDLAVGYTWRLMRFPTDPDGAAWDNTKITNGQLQVGARLLGEV